MKFSLQKEINITMMTKILKYCFDKWWRPIIFLFLTIVLFVASEFIDQPSIHNIFFYLCGMGLLTLTISTIYQLLNKRWPEGILTFILIVFTITGFFLFSIVKYLEAQFEPDRFADNLIIPANIQIDSPKYWSSSEIKSERLANQKIEEPDFKLYISFQPGIFKFDFWTGKLENGTIYLKAYEITQNHSLSTNTLPKPSSVKVFNPKDSIIRFSATSEFTIYEGDFGKPYAARFEVWFKPDTGGAERKLFEKNYIIEGWQM